MKKITAGLLTFSVLAAVIFAVRVNRVEAGWSWRDLTGVDPVRVCRDGIYLGVAAEFEEGDVLVRANLQPDDEVVFERYYVVGEDLAQYDPTLFSGAYYGYFLERWDRPLTPGDVVALDGRNPGPSEVVKDCYVDLPEPPSGFSFQGILKDGEEPANGAYDFRFRAWDAPSGGQRVGDVVVMDDVSVVDGAFTVQLDFGDEAISTGRARWMDMRVRPGDSDSFDDFTTLSPRQEIMAAPYAQTLAAGAVISASHTGPALTVANYLNGALEVSGARGGLTVSGGEEAAIRVQGTLGAGIVLSGSRGIEINNASDSLLGHPVPAIDIFAPTGDGMVISEAGDRGAFISSPGSDGLEIDNPGAAGVNVDSAGTHGVDIQSPGSHGVYIGSPTLDGVNIDTPGSDGVEIDSPVWDGVSIYSPGFDGINIYSPGSDGMVVYDADLDGVYASTSGIYGFYTPDQIHGSNISAASFSLVAQVGGEGALQAGDLAAAAGATTLAGSEEVLLPQVVRADATNGAAVIGVVESRLVLDEDGQGRDERGETDAAGEDARAHVREPHLRPAEGPAQPGEYVSLIIYGVTYVRVDPAATVEAGMRLTAADTEGAVRPLVTTTVDDVPLSEDAPVVGIALAAPEPGSDLAPVFVTVR